MRFLGLGLEDGVPDATTVWLFREGLAKAGLVEKLFDGFGRHLEAKGYIARGGQIVDATIVSAPKQRNSRAENDAIKAGKTPEGWEQKPAKNARDRTRTRGGPRSTGKASTATRTTSASTASTSSSVATLRPMPPCTTARSSTMCWTRPTPATRR